MPVPRDAAKPELSSLSASNRKRVAILISGRGSNMASLISATMEADYPALVTKVISNKTSASGLEIAKSYGIETAVILRSEYDSDETYEQALIDELSKDEPAFICLAGFMRILSDIFVHRFANRILNIHPSLLPSFKGLDTHHRALANGVRLHGCTVHVVTHTLDDGPIIAQSAVRVFPDDSDESLGARVLEAEHKLYPKVLAMMATGSDRKSVV